MGKKKKTLKQKKLADQRLLKEPHGDTSIDAKPSSKETSPYIYTLSHASARHTHAPSQTYSLQHDLRKTLLVSSGILLFLIVLSVLLHKYSLVLPLVFVRY